MEPILGRDVALITLDTLRYDIAQLALKAGKTPVLGSYFSEWEKRHSPGSFTWSAHQAFFAGFLPTPAKPGLHPRRFALSFPGSETTDKETVVFDAPTIVQGFADSGYRTICIGGTGFFNKQTALGSVMPGFFQESYWSPELGVTQIDAPIKQVALACERIASAEKPAFLFLNISAIHQPNRMYLPGAPEDCKETHLAALQFVDRALSPLLALLKKRGAFCILCSDHGTAYGEDGFKGHRLGHPVVWTVPYVELQFGNNDGQ
jgi:hypothetical protein